MAEKKSFSESVKGIKKGALTKRAEAAGESLTQYMDEPHKNPKIEKEVNLARVFRRIAARHRGK